MTGADHSCDISGIKAVVLVPAYNASSTIGETLVALQKDPELHRIKTVIILDDASNDGTADVARAAWQSPVPLEVRVNKHNAGQWPTTNSGLAGLPPCVEWAFILHADDVVKPNWLSLYLNAIIGCPEHVATICSSYDVWRPDTGDVVPGEESPSRPNDLVSGTREAVLGTLNRGCWWHISGCVIRTRAFHQIGGFKSDMPYCGDWEWLLRCLAKGFSVLYLPRSTMLYRQHVSSVASISFSRGWDIEEKLRILSDYRDQGYVSPTEYRRKVGGVVWHLSRRTLVRAIRRDMKGVGRHGSLLAVTLAKYLVEHFRAVPRRLDS